MTRKKVKYLTKPKGGINFTKPKIANPGGYCANWQFKA